MTAKARQAEPLIRRTARSLHGMGRSCALAAITTALCTVTTTAAAQPDAEPEPTTPASPSPATAAPPMTTPPPTTLPPPQAPIFPEDPPCVTKRPDGGERTLKNHVFIFPAFVTSPVVASYVGLRLRLGVNDVSNVPTAIGISTVNTVTFNEGLDVGIKITDWLGINATGGVRSLIGTNLRALTYAGATYDIGGNGGLTLRLLRNEDTGSQLSLSGTLGYTSGQVSTLYPMFDQPILSIVDALQGDLGSSIRTPFSTFSYGGKLAFAQSFGRFFGLQASGGLGGGSVTLEPYNRLRKTRDSNTTREVTFSVGAAPSFDFNAFRIPFAVMPEYVLLRQASDAQIRGSGQFDTVHLVAVGVYYSGRPNLQVGLIRSTQLGVNPLQTPDGLSGTPSSQDLELLLRYVW